MSDARRQKCRDAYQCPTCYGSGRTGEYDECVCDTCKGEGVFLGALPAPTFTGRPIPSLAASQIAAEGLRVLASQCSLVQLVNRDY